MIYPSGMQTLVRDKVPNGPAFSLASEAAETCHGEAEG